MHIHGDGADHEMLPKWVQLSSALILIFSIVGGYFFQKSIKKMRIQKVEGITVRVEGMTCSHCEANVKRNLESIKGITSVVADNRNNIVKISGSKINLEKVKETVNSLGYKFVE